MQKTTHVSAKLTALLLTRVLPMIKYSKLTKKSSKCLNRFLRAMIKDPSL